MKITLDSVNLFVRNINKTLQFYSLLGFTFNEVDYKKDYVKLAFGPISLCFYSEKIVTSFFNDPTISSSRNHSFELSFRVDQPKEVDLIYNKMVENGYNSFKQPINSDWNQRVAFLTDPDNNLVEICAFIKKENT
jgi:predicted lactoylglutathione lyase